MNYFNKNKTISLIVILLLVINITALVTIFAQRHELIKPQPPSQKNDIERTTQFLKNELQFSNEQIDTFMILQKDFIEKNKIYQRSIGDLKFELYESLRLDQSIDTALILSKIANNSYLMEENSYKFFQKLKDLCNAEQSEKFDMLMIRIQMKINPNHRPPEDMEGRPQNRPGHPDDRQGPPPGKHGERPLPPHPEQK